MFDWLANRVSEVIQDLALVQWLWLGALSAIVFGAILLPRRRLAIRLPFPPGPKGLPILGNALQMPDDRPWLVYRDWAKQYGEIVYIKALGQPIVILQSVQAVRSILEEKASNFSDRPSVPTVEMMGFGWSLGVMAYGTLWRTYRRTFHQFLSPNVIPKYHPIIERQTRSFLRALLATPDNFLQHTRSHFASTIMEISYGVSDPEYNKILIQNAEVIVKGLADGVVPGRYLVNILPFLRYVPSWLPGAGWKRQLEHLAVINQETITRPFEDAKMRLSDSEDEYPSIASQAIEALPAPEDPRYNDQERIAKGVAAISYVAGADTTVSSAHALILALAMNPGIQQRAQEELDAVVGTNRLPCCTDIPRLPYLGAILIELARWHTVTPLAFPHQSIADDEYGGYLIPKGTLVFANSWALMHDEDMFPDPETFRPERFWNDGKLEVAAGSDCLTMPFGYGRRICPGRHISNESLAIMAASLLAVFDIRPATDEAGRDIPLQYEAKSESILIQPLPFKCSITPRSLSSTSLLSD
ncbi:cytochrome P450 98A3 [Coprinopsis sp. MPI-PUGE-AT-0042]|nr:cytochrome P450 98A3 [Coprinopsis sp. MPI-PUGE-AT-0042]